MALNAFVIFSAVIAEKSSQQKNKPNTSPANSGGAIKPKPKT
jgi:hypothetical protein